MEINVWYTTCLILALYVSFTMVRVFDLGVDDYIMDHCPGWVFDLDLKLTYIGMLLLISAMMWAPVLIALGMEAAAGRMWGLIMI